MDGAGYENCTPRRRCRETPLSVASQLNMIELEIDALFSDLAGLVVAGFFIDPPTVGPLFGVGISKMIAVAGAGQKNGDQQNDAYGRHEKPAFAKERVHDGANPWKLMLTVFSSAVWPKT